MPGGLGALGRVLVGVGVLVAALGLLLVVADRFPGLRIGRLPGDVSFGRGSFRVYLPLATSILLSLLLTLVLWIASRFR